MSKTFVEKAIDEIYERSHELDFCWHDIHSGAMENIVRLVLERAQEQMSLMLGGPHSSSIFSVDDILRCMERLRSE